jgi:hypothetical protein
MVRAYLAAARDVTEMHLNTQHHGRVENPNIT